MLSRYTLVCALQNGSKNNHPMSTEYLAKIVPNDKYRNLFMYGYVPLPAPIQLSPIETPSEETSILGGKSMDKSMDTPDKTPNTIFEKYKVSYKKSIIKYPYAPV